MLLLQQLCPFIQQSRTLTYWCGSSGSAEHRICTECSTAFSRPPAKCLLSTFSCSASPRVFSPHSRHRSGSDSFLHICWYWQLQGKEKICIKKVWPSPRDVTFARWPEVTKKPEMRVWVLTPALPSRSQRRGGGGWECPTGSPNLSVLIWRKESLYPNLPDGLRVLCKL